MNEESTDKSSATPRKSSPWWLVTLKILGWTIFSVIILVLLLCTLTVWILKPAQLTPLVEKHASAYLDADVRAAKVELTFWHSFPRMTLDIDSLSVVTRSLSSLPDSLRASLPADADTLLTVGRFHGGVNIAALSIGEISLYDIIIERPSVNIVQVNQEYANYVQVPASADTVPADDSEAYIPPISINRFAIIDSKPIRYRSMADSTDISVILKNINFSGHKAPDYQLSVIADGKSPMLGMVNLDDLRITLDGGIKWDREKPMAVGLRDFTLGLDSISADWNCDIDFTDSIRINSLDIRLNEWRLPYLLTLLPRDIARQFRGLDTDLKMTLDARLTAPYTVTDSLTIPSVSASFEIPECHIHWNNLNFNRFSFLGNATVDGHDPDRSTIDVKRFIIDGKVIKIDFTGDVSTPISDPCFDGRLKAGFDFSRLPRFAYSKIARVMGGKMTADVSLLMKKSHLSPNRFHLINLDGDVDLDNFIFGSLDSVTNLYITSSCLRFGTGRKYRSTDSQIVDSLMTVSLEIDSMCLADGPLVFKGAGMKGGVGCRLTRFVPKDSSAVIPLGGMVAAKSLSLDDRTDSLRLRFTGVRCDALLKRFEDDMHSPWLQMQINADRMMMRDTAVVIGLRDSHFGVSAHLRKRRIRALPDSISSARRDLRAGTAAESDPSALDIEVDSGLKTALQRWDVRGSIRSEGGGFFSRALQVRNTVRNVNLSFSTDSVVLRDLEYRLGKSDFTINGTVSNIRRALTRRRNNVLKINFDVRSDTININEISRLIFAGGGNMDISEISDEMAASSEIPEMETITDSAITGPFIVPSNIEADIDISADNVLYTDMMFHDFNGCIKVQDKMLTLNRLGANNEIGGINISAMYSTPQTDSLSFGLGMKVSNFHIDKVMKLIPAIDSLMPMLHDFSGIINADIAATSLIDSNMNLMIPSLKAAIHLSGDSLVLIDADTFKSLSKWLMFKNKRHNMIDSMSVEMIVDNSQIEIFPFIFDIDRYRLGVMGSNDLNMNLNYHISVLKSPFPFKFGINIKGNIDDMKIRLGGAKVKPGSNIGRISIADTTRINLVRQIENVFRRSAHSGITINTPAINRRTDDIPDNISASDSLLMIKEGLIEVPLNTDSIPAK